MILNPTGAIASVSAFLLAIAPASGEARSADYSEGSQAILRYGAELKVAHLTTELHPGIRIASITASPGADHVTLALGIYCSAYKIENPISKLLQMLQKEWNTAIQPDIQPPPIELDIIVSNGSSYRRCVETKEMSARCITRVKLNGTVQAKGNSTSEPIPISADVERDAAVGGLCGNIGRGIAVISREAALELIADAERKTIAALKQ